MGPSEDRRRFPRLCKTATLRAQVLAYNSRTPKKEMSACLDIGGGGLRFRAPEGYPDGTLLKIETEIPGWGQTMGRFDSVSGSVARQLLALGKVVRVETAAPGEYEVAVQFIALDAQDHRSLVDFVQQLREMEKLELEH